MARRALDRAQLELVRAVRSALPATGAGLVLGCSGGADSLALAAALAHLAAPRVLAVVVDHGLQPGSDAVARHAAGQLDALGLRTEVRRVEPPRGQGTGLEAAARAARLEALARDGLPVWLAHTLDDQAETVLLGLARGSGAASLQAMAPVRHDAALHVDLVRPLLQVRRSTTVRACREWGLEPWQDPMNRDERFLRVRARHRVVPVLEEQLGPGVARSLARTAELLRHDNDLLERLALDSLRDLVRGEALDAVGLLHLHPALRGRVLRLWLLDRGVPAPGMTHVRAVAALVEHWHGQRGVDLPGGVTVRRDGGHLVAGEGLAG